MSLDTSYYLSEQCATLYAHLLLPPTTYKIGTKYTHNSEQYSSLIEGTQTLSIPSGCQSSVLQCYGVNSPSASIRGESPYSDLQLILSTI